MLKTPAFLTKTLKGVLLLVCLIGLTPTHLWAQKDHDKDVISLFGHKNVVYTDNPEHHFFNVGLWPSLSTGGENHKRQTNNISFNFLGSQSYNEYGFSFNVLFGEIYNNARGFHFSGFAQRIYNKGEGVSMAFLYNMASRYDGVMLNVGFSSAEQMRGVMIGGFNGSVDMQGVQVGFANQAASLRGAQVGLFNFSSNIEGVQIGLVNAKKTSGVQIGFANIADESKYPIGLLNFIKNGKYSTSLEVDELSNTTLNYRSGGEGSYGILGLGYNFYSNLHHYVGQIGWGVHFPISQRFKINTELMLTWMTSPRTERDIEGNPIERMLSTRSSYDDRPAKRRYNFRALFKPNLRILPTYHISENVSVYGGPTLNFMRSNVKELNDHLFPSHSLWKETKGNRREQLYVGYMAGIKYTFRK